MQTNLVHMISDTIYSSNIGWYCNVPDIKCSGWGMVFVITVYTNEEKVKTMLDRWINIVGRFCPMEQRSLLTGGDHCYWQKTHLKSNKLDLYLQLSTGECPFLFSFQRPQNNLCSSFPAQSKNHLLTEWSQCWCPLPWWLAPHPTDMSTRSAEQMAILSYKSSLIKTLLMADKLFTNG